MTGLEKALRGFSILTIVFACIALMEGATYLLGIEVPGMEVPEGSSPVALGVLALVNGTVYFVVGCLGAARAKDPSRLGAFMALATAGLVLALVIGAYDVATGGFDLVIIVPPIMHITFMAACLLLGRAVIREARK